MGKAKKYLLSNQTQLGSAEIIKVNSRRRGQLLGLGKDQAHEIAPFDLNASVGLGPGKLKGSCTLKNAIGSGLGDLNGPSSLKDWVGLGSGKSNGSSSFKAFVGLGPGGSKGTRSLKETVGHGPGNKSIWVFKPSAVSDGVNSGLPSETCDQYQEASGYYSDIEIHSTKKMVRRAASVPLNQKKIKSPCTKVLKRVRQN